MSRESHLLSSYYLQFTNLPAKLRNKSETAKVSLFNYLKICISRIYFVSLQCDCNTRKRAISQKRINLLAPAARCCHDRHKALPRPLQTFATPAANVPALALLPVRLAFNPFSLGLSPPFPLAHCFLCPIMP